jgi:hypothetical protein
MIRLPAPASSSAPEQRPVTLLAELARLVPVADPSANVVSIEVTDRPASFPGIREWRAAGWGIEAGDGVVRIARGSLACVSDLLAATAEARTSVRDRFGRVPAEANALAAVGLEREPVVSQAAVALRGAVVKAAGRRPVRLAVPWPDGRRWAVALTHDLDVVALWPAFTTLRLIELVRKRQWDLAGRTLSAAVRSIGRSPVAQGIRWLLAAERARSVRSTWFVLCGTPSWRSVAAGDLTYRPEAEATRRLLAAITSGKHGIGLHGSLETVSNSGAFSTQRRRLQGLVGQAVDGVRQHFLRFDPASTPQAMRRSGFRYDSTVGFPDRNGFRIGVADVVPLGEETSAGDDPLLEAPFAWMDRALSKYRGVEDPDAWAADALELAHRCRDVEGLWVGVWHPNLVDALGFPGAPPAYERLLDAILADRPFAATLDTLVAWRVARRALRFTRVAEDGRGELTAGAPGSIDVPLETIG